MGDNQKLDRIPNDTKILNLSRKNITADMAINLAKDLENNKTLLGLNLAHNPIGDNGAKALGIALGKNNTLQYLNLMTNEIGDDGAVDLAEGLLQNTSLKELVLWNNSIGNKGGLALAIAIQYHKSLMSVDLRFNNFSEATQNLIVYAVGESSSIIECYLTCDSKQLRLKLQNYLDRYRNLNVNITQVGLNYYNYKRQITPFSIEIDDRDVDEAIQFGKNATAKKSARL